jgi:hypothetical protein
LRAIVACRGDEPVQHTWSLRRTYAGELGKLRRQSPQQTRALRRAARWLDRDDKMLRDTSSAPGRQRTRTPKV